MKKVLFVNFNCIFNTHFETELELMHKHQLGGDEVYSLCCSGELKKFCAAAYQSTDKLVCDYCQAKYRKGIELIKLPVERVFTLKRATAYPDFTQTKYNSIEELAHVSYYDIDIGDNIVRTFQNTNSIQNIKITDIPEKYIRTTLMNSIDVYNNFTTLYNTLAIDAVYLFSGRFPEYHPVIRFCEREAIDYYVHDRGANFTRYSCMKNSYFNNINKVIEYFVQAPLERSVAQGDRDRIGREWFEAQAKGKGAHWLSYTREQKKQMLPETFDTSKYNVALFNTSLHEAYIDDSFLPKACFLDEIALLTNLCASFKDKSEYYFTLRAHPNISPGEQRTNLEKLKENGPENLTVILPDEKVDTYALIREADIVVATCSSTVGAEATFARKPSMVLGPCYYQDLDIAYRPADFAEFVELLGNKVLPPKPYENVLKYGYSMASYGEKFEYYQPTGIFEGIFMGVDLNKSHKFLPLLGKIKRFYYKQKASIMKRLKPGSC